MEFRVLLDCQILTPPPHVTVQLPQEPHAAQEASTARGDICQFSWAIKKFDMKEERNNPYYYSLQKETYGRYWNCMIVMLSLRLYRLLGFHHIGLCYNLLICFASEWQTVWN